MATKRDMFKECIGVTEAKRCDTCAHNVYGQCNYNSPCFNWSGWKPKQKVRYSECAENRKPVMVPVMFDEFALRGIHSKCYKQLDIVNVIFNEPATIVFWNDGTKTVVKAAEDDEFDPEKGMAMAISKKIFGNQGSYYNKIKKWTEKYDPRSPIEKLADTISELRKKHNDELIRKSLETAELLRAGTKKMRLVEANIESLKGKKGK